MNPWTVVRRFRRTTLVLAALSLLLALVSRVDAAGSVGPELLPEGTLGFVHFQVEQLGETTSAAYVSELISQVDSELAEFSLKHLGVDVTKLKELTVIVPPLDVVASPSERDAPPFLIAATFGSKFNPQDLLNALPQGWDTTVNTGATYYVHEDHGALVFDSARTLIYGSELAVQWWLAARQNGVESDLADLLRESLGDGQIYFGLNATALPSEYNGQLPSFIAPVAQAQFATLVADLDEGLAVDLELFFEDEDSADRASQSLDSIVQQATALLSFQEAQFKQTLTNPETTADEGLEAIAGLAVVRQAASHLEDLSIEQEDETITIEAYTDIDSTLLVFGSLAAIQAIGQQAEAEFESVSAQLEPEFDDFDE